MILILANVTAALMAMMIGAASPSNSVANMAGSLAIMLFLLFGGFMLNKDQVRLGMDSKSRCAGCKQSSATETLHVIVTPRLRRSEPPSANKTLHTSIGILL